ncbi:hypothetical protein GTQ99_13635 [Kineococcus sp. T13]|uniref:hypothetical protein n=1 Tax=Kineococcus vitellinus TaxID=2696565 RepID=UPI001411F906|nr:hypothetical protein [Kineococcus vitellinus]NAZ76447.1 hypothetical protein [Kineococcus vitellinus]
MPAARYRVTINGFWCHNETWDDAFNWDGKHDEVVLAVNVRDVDADGQTLRTPLDSESELLGDTHHLPNRVKAGSASPAGGIVSGDKFPTPRPWQRSAGELNTSRVPPYVVWEGDLPPGERMVLLTPTVWEWDPGAGFWDGWLEWQVAVDATYGQRAKEVFGGIWPVAKPVFDAVSLGIQTVGTLAGLWSPLGKSMRRPVGLQRNPDDPDGFLFNPVTIALNSDSAEFLIADDPQGFGKGIVGIRYVDDPYLRGVYSLFLQVERVGAAPASQVPLQSDWRWCSRCQGLFWGGGQPASVCPEGGAHAPQPQSGSGDYSLPHGAPPDAGRQAGWRWCDRCQGLYYGPAVADSTCPAGGTHAPAATSGSGDYALAINAAPAAGSQSGWRWCSRCQGLFWGGGQAGSTCPEGGPHASPGESRSGDYSLLHVPAGT